MTRKRSGTYTYSEYVDIEIDVADALPEATDDDLRDECVERGWKFFDAAPQKESPQAEDFRSLADDLRNAFALRDGVHFEVLLIRFLVKAGIDPSPPIYGPKQGVKT